MRAYLPNHLPQFSLCSFGPRTPQRYRQSRLKGRLQFIQPSSIIRFRSSPGPANRLAVCKPDRTLQSCRHADISTSSSGHIAFYTHSQRHFPVPSDSCANAVRVLRRGISSPAANIVRCPAGSPFLCVHSQATHVDAGQFPSSPTSS